VSNDGPMSREIGVARVADDPLLAHVVEVLHVAMAVISASIFEYLRTICALFTFARLPDSFLLRTIGIVVAELVVVQGHVGWVAFWAFRTLEPVVVDNIGVAFFQVTIQRGFQFDDGWTFRTLKHD
jgi:hypothetical protein